MKDENAKNIELSIDESGAVPITGHDPKTRKTLSRIKIELSDEELASSGVQKMLVEELGRCQDAISTMEVFREKYHKADKDLALALEKNKHNISIEIISGSCLAAGAAAFGYAPSLTSLPIAGWIAVAFGLLLTAAGVLAKAIQLK